MEQSQARPGPAAKRAAATGMLRTGVQRCMASAAQPDPDEHAGFASAAAAEECDAMLVCCSARHGPLL